MSSGGEFDLVPSGEAGEFRIPRSQVAATPQQQLDVARRAILDHLAEHPELEMVQQEDYATDEIVLRWGRRQVIDDANHQPTCDTLQGLALPYADHPDYREEWRP